MRTLVTLHLENLEQIKEIYFLLKGQYPNPNVEDFFRRSLEVTDFCVIQELTAEGFQNLALYHSGEDWWEYLLGEELPEEIMDELFSSSL